MYIYICIYRERERAIKKTRFYKYFLLSQFVKYIKEIFDRYTCREYVYIHGPRNLFRIQV